MNQRRSKVVLLASGGLTSWAMAYYLAEKHDLTVLIADVGQKDPGLQRFIESLQKKGINYFQVDLRKETGAMAMELTKLNLQYQQGYWNTTGALRYVLLSNLGRLVLECGAEYLAHGCVGFGNDHRRFERYCETLWPSVKVMSPWKGEEFSQLFQSRADLFDYVNSQYPINDLMSIIHWSSDGSVMGVSHEGSAIESVDSDWLSLTPFLLTCNKPQAVAVEEDIFFQIRHGNVTAVNGERGSEFDLINKLNQFAGNRRLGLSCTIEDRISQSKCRGVYEAPALHLIGMACSYLRAATFAAPAMELFENNSKKLATLLYSGRYAESYANELKRYLSEMASHLDGQVQLRAGPGYATCIGATMDGKTKFEERFRTGGIIWRQN